MCDGRGQALRRGSHHTEDPEQRWSDDGRHEPEPGLPQSGEHAVLARAAHEWGDATPRTRTVPAAAELPARDGAAGIHKDPSGTGQTTREFFTSTADGIRSTGRAPAPYWRPTHDLTGGYDAAPGCHPDDPKRARAVPEFSVPKTVHAKRSTIHKPANVEPGQSGSEDAPTTAG